MKIFRILVLAVVFVNAGDFSQSNDVSFGANISAGASMGGGVEVGFSLYKDGGFEIYNFLSLNGLGLKLIEDKYDYAAVFAQEKITFSYLLGSSIMSFIGFDYFRPYLFISGGFGGIFGKRYAPYKLPYYYEIFAGLGHEFITENGHTFFFELGGGTMNISSKLSDIPLNNTLGGNFKFLLGYRIYL